MRRNLLIVAVFVALSAAAIVLAQTRRTTPPAAKPAAEAVPAIDLGAVSDRTYRNDTFNFELSVPEGWLIADPKAETTLKEQGIDLKLKAPKASTTQEQTRLNGYAKRVTVLLTAIHPQSKDENTVMRVAVEDLRRTPQVKDAVDYFDLMREGYKTIRLPSDFKYSETQAEKLGRKQFGYLDTQSAESKTRMYATVRNGYAIIFNLTYRSDEDLQTFRQMLSDANFSLK
jgi:hypothetical protein